MRVDILTCNDGLEVRLSITDFEPGEWNKLFPSARNLKGFLLAKGLAPDLIEDSAADSIHSLLAESLHDPGKLAITLKEVQSLSLASGEPPVHEEAEGLMFHKPYLSDPQAVDTLERRLREHGLEEGRKAVNPEYFVEAGQTILSFFSVRQGKAGRDVYGKDLPFRPYTAALPVAGRGISKLETKWEAKDAGFLVLFQDTLQLLGADGARPGLVRVSDDKLAAWLVLRKESARRDLDIAVAFDSVRAEMAAKGLRPMQDEVMVRRCLEAFFRDETEQEVLLVEGVLPKPGKNGSIELLVDPEPDLPDPESIRNVDFRAFTFFRAVGKGDRLARIAPPQPGVAGMDVFGNITLPKPGAPVKVNPGRNTEFAPHDPNLILASKDGKLAVEDGIPHVVDTLRISEDVSFKTGNLKFPGSIEVEGNVLDKFTVEAKGDVGISGVVENGVVVSGGSIIIKGGVLGNGAGLIKSKLSSVTIGFIHNQRIESHSNIIVYNEVLNAQLLTRKSALMKSASHSVIGGHIVAYENIEIHNAGNEAGARTILEVGKDFEVEAEILRKRETLKSVRADLEFLEKRRNNLELIVRWEAGKNPENRLLEKRVKGVLNFLDRLRQGLNAKINELEAALHNPADCYISVSGTAYPGTLLKHKDKIIPINEALRGKRWLFKAG